MKELQNFNSSNNKNLLVVLPINKLEDYPLNECLYSLAQQTQPVDLLVLVKDLTQDQMDNLKKIIEAPQITVSKKDDNNEVTKETIDSLKDLNFVIENTTADSFGKVFNEALNYADKNNYAWFSVIEYDDVVDMRWFSKALIYADGKPDMDGFFPLTREISNGAFLGFFNEACWVDGYAEISGIFDLQLLLRFNCINITGGVFKVASLKDKSECIDGVYKPIKESIKIGYSYEFFLRMIYNDLKFYSVPRIGYEHRIDRPSPTVNYFSSKLPRDLSTRAEDAGGISNDEQSFWLNTVKKEYYFEEDRNVQYVPKA